MADARRNTFFTALNIPFESEQAKGKYSLTLANFSFITQQLVLSYILYPCKCPEVHLPGILAQFLPNKHFSQMAMFSLNSFFLLTWQNAPEGGYDEKSWEMAYNWLMMTSSGDDNWSSGSLGLLTDKT